MTGHAGAQDRVSLLRALEALRNGVPNGDAVNALGCAQPQVLGRFEEQLEELGANPPPVVTGALVSGDFGAGKSHLLEYLEHIAVSRGFVCSRVVISKETPLHDPSKVVQAALREARFPDGRGSVIHELASRIDYRSRQAAAFVEWAMSAPGLIGATVHLHERSHEHELIARILDFWSGEKIGVAEVRAGLKSVGSRGAYDVKAIKIRDLAPLRLEFATRFARAVGMRGWVLLIDELELAGRYTLQQRAKSYAELARWLGLAEGAVPGVAVVATITDDFDIKVLQEKDDLVLVPERLRSKGTEDAVLLAARAEVGMRAIERDKIPLMLPNEETLKETYTRLEDIYSRAYGAAPQLDTTVTTMRRPIRSYIRRWINEWDLLRYRPDAHLDTEVGELEQRYDEEPELGQGSAESDGE
ncbi:MAG: DUF2791 family P-loop domain-containing protein [Acidimicrobiia bacterium]|nr:DUF2791 family P-loop domain-containing protein [Acidimicrobiia bacterium]